MEPGRPYRRCTWLEKRPQKNAVVATSHPQNDNTPRARHHARVGNLSAAVTPADRELTVGKRLSDVVLHFRDTGAIEVGAVHE